MTLSRRQLLGLLGTAAATAPLLSACATGSARTPSLQQAYKNDFLIGTALSVGIINGAPSPLSALIAREFNAITPENCMKWEEMRNADGSWNWGDADAFVAFGKRHNMHMIGHTLVWHSQIPDAVFKDGAGKDITAAALQQKMEQHIQTLVDRYKGQLQSWDVVNEAIGDDLQMRNSHWYRILGEDFIHRAFSLAQEADPKAKLLYNDYNIERGAKRDATIAMLKRLQKRGTPIHGIGIQGHINLEKPGIDEIEQSILAFADLGLRVSFTELDIDVLPQVWDLPVAEISTRFDYTPERDPYPQGLPANMQDALARRYESLFALFLKHRDKIDRISLWGTSDDASWLNDFPIKGRTNYPLLFDRSHQPKPAYFRVLDLKK